ncbi:hypothetical protein B0H63DRAFT_520516 [Podospora didyma]|uniref:Uncharacterized protein n=1 Tax=Podospora didyma TaxID=330526 RepID=A0AAE0NRL3_9PEZI|nr:hypothetical protein B0H63DRAFT_520516 [Podospora didyma]
MSSASGGNNNCLYGMLGVDGSAPYPVRFEPCNPLREDVLWRFVLHGSSGYNIFNKAWMGTKQRLDTNCHKAGGAQCIMWMGASNDTKLTPVTRAVEDPVRKHWRVYRRCTSFISPHGNGSGRNLLPVATPQKDQATASTNTTAADTRPTDPTTSTKPTGISDISTTAASSSSTSTTAPTASTSNSDDKKEMSKGEIAGTIVGPIGALAAVIGLFLKASASVIRVLTCGRKGGQPDQQGLPHGNDQDDSHICTHILTLPKYQVAI